MGFGSSRFSSLSVQNVTVLTLKSVYCHKVVPGLLKEVACWSHTVFRTAWDHGQNWERSQSLGQEATPHMDLIKTPQWLAWRRTYGRARLLFFAQNDFPDVVKDWKEDSSGIIALHRSSVVHSSTSCSISVCHWCFYWTEVASLLTILPHGRCPKSLHLAVCAHTHRTSTLSCLNWILYGSVANLNRKHTVLKL